LTGRLNAGRQRLHHPERAPLRSFLFQIHFLMGAAVGIYITLMSVTGSVIVFRNQLPAAGVVSRIVDLHTNLLMGATGRAINGVGAIGLTLLCTTGLVIWWPGVKNWRRSVTVNWRAHFPRIMWDLHSALGLWLSLLVLMWAVSAVYFSFPRWFDGFFWLDPSDRFADRGLWWLAQLHFGRFSPFTGVVWALLGFVPAVLAFTGGFVCCRRVILGKSPNPNQPERSYAIMEERLNPSRRTHELDARGPG
jgi:uncharacterized iron-regulated membrane protein